MLFNKNKLKLKEYETDYAYYIDATIENQCFQKAMKCITNKNSKIIKIDDIFFKDGHGHEIKMLKKLIRYAKRNGYKKIISDLLSSDDISNLKHKAKQLHLYRRFGFKILSNNGPYDAAELIL